MARPPTTTEPSTTPCAQRRVPTDTAGVLLPGSGIRLEAVAENALRIISG